MSSESYEPQPPFFDRAGHPIGDEAWSALSNDAAYCRLGAARHDVLGHVVRVTTVWCGWRLGADVAGQPMLFETYVEGGVFDGAAWLYPTEAEARLGHQIAVELSRDGEGDPATIVDRLRELQAERSNTPGE